MLFRRARLARDLPRILPAIQDATKETPLYQRLVVFLSVAARALPMLPAFIADINLPDVEDKIVDSVADLPGELKKW